MLGVLLGARVRMIVNTLRAASGRHRVVTALFALFGLALFVLIGAVSGALVRLAQGPAAGLSLPAHALVSHFYASLFVLLLAGSVPFVAATLFQTDDFPLLLSTPVSPRVLVAAKLSEAIAHTSVSQFVPLGLPVLLGLGWGVHLSAAGWGWLLVATLLLLVLPPAATAALLLLAARLLGMRRVRFAVTLISIGLGLTITALAVVGISRAVRAGTLDTARLSAALHGDALPGQNPFAQLRDDVPRCLPSAWAASMLADTAGGRRLAAQGRDGLLLLAAATGLLVWLCLRVGPRVLASEAFLETDGAGLAAHRTGIGLGPLRRLPPATAGLVVKDLKYVFRDLILLGQVGTALLLFLVPFLLRIALNGVGGADQDLFGYLALSLLVVIVYMVTSILALTSVGLEGRGFWMVMASPVSRRAFLQAKWLLSFGLSALVVLLLLAVTWLAFQLSAVLVLAALGVLTCACFALSGLGVGLAGLFPRFVYENPAFRASLYVMVLGFVFAAGYLVVCCLIPALAYLMWTRGIAAPGPAAWGAAFWFVAVSAATGGVPVALAERRLRGYEWEF